ncbi:hypothetical protein N5079_29730 [Planotetraspora sp. A-T 1434]|uniref:hypothetical protein n=1 Tax=Planotetraspora sp. A-T 1434 TaxID=2979219 RepID=UPI0021C1C12D|nr:hypothetical protein [Planotetraspora sp. A-T 1434]MCT9934393.1 hypothetical protein [Planotetraspora sp. A-T 1434]
MLLLQGAIDLPEATAYLDDGDDLRFHILPKVPILRREAGKAVFKFVKYRTLKPLASGDVGAALVFMDIELALTDQQEQTVRGKLAQMITARRGPGAQPVDPNQLILTKPQVSTADVTVEVLAASGDLVQRVNNAGKPSMYGNNVVAISAELTQFGAPVFEAVMSSQGAGGVRVVYDLTFAARMPPVRAVGTWVATKFYNFVQEVDFEENFWSEDDFSEHVTEIFRNSESRVVEVDPGALPNGDPETAKLLDIVRGSVERQLDEAVKRNLLEAVPPENRDFSKVRDDDFENIKRSVMVDKRSDVHIEVKENQVTTVEVHPQANMQSLVSQGFTWTDYSMEVDLDDPFFRQLNLTIQVNADFVELPIFSVDVKIDYPPHTRDHGIQTFGFRKADDVGKFNAFISGGSTKFKYQYVVNYKGESRVFTSEWIEDDTNDLKINVDELGLWLVDIEVGDMNFDQVTRAVLTLEHPEVAPGVPPVNRFQIDKDTKKATVKELLLKPVQPYGGSIKYFMQDGREYVKELTGLKGQRFYVDDPFSATRTVQLRTRGDFDRRIDTIFVDLSYADDGNDYRQSTSIALQKDKRFFDWSFPVIDERQGAVTYRAITTFRDGTSTDSGDLPITGKTLLLGEESVTLSVKIVPDLIDWTLVKLATVEIHYTDPGHGIDERGSFTFRKPGNEQLFELAIQDKTQKSYTWKAKFFMADGSRKEIESPGPVTDADLIIELPA